MFKVARKLSPCILFFDEIDCIGRARNNFQSTPQSQSMTEELLVQLDGENDPSALTKMTIVPIYLQDSKNTRTKLLSFLEPQIVTMN